MSAAAPKFPWPQWEARLKELAAQGMNSPQIAEQIARESRHELSGAKVRAMAAKIGIRFAPPRHPAHVRGEMKQRIESMWAESLSLSQIASAISREFNAPVSRNTVTGIISRLGLPKRPDKSLAARIQGKKPEAAKPPKPGPIAMAGGVGFASLKTQSPKPPVLPPERNEQIPKAQRVSFADLDDSPWAPRKCRWPLGTPGMSDFFFCGGKPSKRSWGRWGCPYCDEHADRATSKRAT